MIDEAKLSATISSQSSDPIFSAAKYYDLGGVHIVSMRDKIANYARVFLSILMALPGREIDYDFAVREAIDFIRQEREGMFRIDSAGFKREYSHTAFVYLVEAARMYASALPKTEIIAVLELALKELRP